MNIKIKILAGIISLLVITSPLLSYAQDASSTDSTDTTIATPEEISVPPIAIQPPELAATSTEILPEETVSEIIATSTPETPDIATSTSLELMTSTTTETAASSTETAPAPQSSESSEETATTTSTSTPSIVSGQAVALANILNIVNTNFLNSSGVVLFSNFFDYLANTLDLRNALSGNSSCGTGPCTSGEEVNINVSNDASIDNEILLNASSGGNKINNAGDATINTGDAYAGLNLINLANNNFIDSNYLLVTLNAFGGVGGDIVFPSLNNFFGSLSSGASSPSAINLNNQAEINNNVSTDASSGDNQTNNTGESTISTGNANSSSNVFNEINSNMAGGSKVSILFRVHGDWAGEIFGAPEGLSWLQGGDGSIFLFDNASSTTPTSGNINFAGTSTALINNNVSVVALTGDNQINNANTALISTGNAYAGANIVNVANSNVIGKNWILAIINIFGDFKGNIAFGRPDLWTGEQVTTPEKINNGDELTYKFTVINNGDSRSSNTELVNTYDREHLEILDSSQPYTTNDDGQLVWDLGAMPSSGATEISYHAKIINADYGTEITNTVSVIGHETDNNPEDNTDSATVTTAPAPERHSSGSRIMGMAAGLKNLNLNSKELTVTRDKFVSNLNASGNKVHQKLIVSNPTSGPMTAVTLHDILKDSAGNIIRDEVWDLGTVLAHEEITLGYDIQFAESAPRGLYSLTTAFDGFRNDNSPNGYILLATAVKQKPTVALATTTPELATTSSSTAVRVELVPDNTGIVLAAAVDNQNNTSKIPPITIPFITTVVVLGLWSGYKYKFGGNA